MQCSWKSNFFKHYLLLLFFKILRLKECLCLPKIYVKKSSLLTQSNTNINTHSPLGSTQYRWPSLLFSYIVWHYLLRNICFLLTLTIICTFAMQIPKPKLPTKWEEYAKQKVQKLKFQSTCYCVMLWLNFIHGVNVIFLCLREWHMGLKQWK